MLMFVELVEWIMFLSHFSTDNKSINQASNVANKQKTNIRGHPVMFLLLARIESNPHPPSLVRANHLCERMLTLPSINQSSSTKLAYMATKTSESCTQGNNEDWLPTTAIWANIARQPNMICFDFRSIDRLIDRYRICETKYKTTRILFKTWQQWQLLCYSIQMIIHWQIMTQTNYHTHSSDRFGDKTNPPKVFLRRPTACLSVNQSINDRFAPTAYTREWLPPNKNRRLPWHFISREEHNESSFLDDVNAIRSNQQMHQLLVVGTNEMNGSFSLFPPSQRNSNTERRTHNKLMNKKQPKKKKCVCLPIAYVLASTKNKLEL